MEAVELCKRFLRLLLRRLVWLCCLYRFECLVHEGLAIYIYEPFMMWYIDYYYHGVVAAYLAVAVCGNTQGAGAHFGYPKLSRPEQGPLQASHMQAKTTKDGDDVMHILALSGLSHRDLRLLDSLPSTGLPSVYPHRRSRACGDGVICSWPITNHAPPNPASQYRVY